MTIFTRMRFSRRDDHYVEVIISFDVDEFLEAAKLANAFTAGFSVQGELRVTILEMALFPQSSLNVFNYRQSNELGLLINKYLESRVDE